ncbi:MAG: mechanosensitive ion channel [Arenicellales bacterium]|nr:mechanosensitive ion channel [Arenicellales bacterium]
MNVENWTTTLTGSIARVAERTFEFLPTILGAAVLLLIGWLIARTLRVITRRLTELGMNRLSRTRSIRAGVRQSATYRSLPVVTGRIVYWTVLLFFLAASLEALGLPAVSSVIGYITAYLPRVLAGIIIIFAGVWVGEIARAFLSRVAVSSGLERTELIGRLAQVLVVVLAVIIALEQLGIDNTILITLTITLFAGILGAAALAFGLGAKTTAANIIAAHYVRREYRTGDRVRIDDVEGTIVEITPTAVSIDTDSERVLVPAERFNVVESIRVK